MGLPTFKGLLNRCFFATGNVNKRTNLFEHNHQLAKYFIDNLKFYQPKFLDDAHIYTLMPEHYHLVVSLVENVDITQYLGNVKRYTAKQILEYLRKHNKDNFWISYTQQIIESKEYQYLVKKLSLNYQDYAAERLKDDNLYQYQKIAYLIDLGLMVSRDKITWPRVILSKKYQDKISKVIVNNQFRKIILRVSGDELINLLENKIFQYQDFKRPIDTEKFFNQKVNYVFENAYRRGLCGSPEEWRWLGGSLVDNLKDLKDD